MAKRATIGAVIEIPTSQGLYYAQYTHQHDMFGGLIRVFDQCHSARPASFANVVNGRVRFSTFLPVRAAVSRGIFEIVALEPVVPANQAFPVFRAGNVDPRTGKVACWWLWDGENEWRVGSITPEQRKLPMKQIWNDTLLISRLEKGWTPETDSW